MAVVAVTTELLGVEVGHWCNQCMLPSGFRVLYVVRRGLSMCFHRTVACRDCDHEDIELTDAPSTIWQS